MVPCKKVHYADQPRALAALLAIRRSKSTGKVPTFAYPCVTCRSWHLTSAAPTSKWARRLASDVLLPLNDRHRPFSTGQSTA